MKRKLLLGLAGAIACSSGGGGPTEPPAGGFNVSGLWIETQHLAENTCAIDVSEVGTVSFTLTQAGVELTANQGGLVATGTINPQTGAFSLSATLTSGSAIFLFTQSGRFESNSRYEAESRNTFTDGVDSCLIRTNDEGQRQ